MGVQVSGDNLVVPGQASVLLPPTSTTHVIVSLYAGTLKVSVPALNMAAAAPIDLTVLPVISANYIPVRCFVYKPTADVSAATLGLYTAAGGGGTAIVAPVLLANLTGVGKFQELTIAALASAITALQLYPRLTVASANPGTANLVLEFMDISLI